MIVITSYSIHYTKLYESLQPLLNEIHWEHGARILEAAEVIAGRARAGVIRTARWLVPLRGSPAWDVQLDSARVEELPPGSDP